MREEERRRGGGWNTVFFLNLYRMGCSLCYWNGGTEAVFARSQHRVEF